jgi:hypothetical protein
VTVRSSRARRAVRTAVVAFGALSVLGARPAQAEPSSEEQALADVRFREGRELMDKQRYDDACTKFDESDRLWSRGGTVLNLAACREKQGKAAAAWVAYTRAIALAQKEGRADREELAKSKVAALQGELSWLVVQVPQELDVPGAVVTRDGTPIGRGSWGVPVPVDPGRHVIVANVPGMAPIEAVVDVGPRGDRRTVAIPYATTGHYVLPPSGLVAPPGAAPPLGPGALGAAGVVRLHVETANPRLRVFMYPAGTVAAVGYPVCAAPCDQIVDGRDGQELYFDGDGITRSAPFFISDRRGDLNANVNAGSSYVSGFGSMFITLGVLGAITGASLLLTGAIIAGNSRPGEPDNGVLISGGITLGASAAALAIGIPMLIVGRTKVKLDEGRAPARTSSLRMTPSGVAIAF